RPVEREIGRAEFSAGGDGEFEGAIRAVGKRKLEPDGETRRGTRVRDREITPNRPAEGRLRRVVLRRRRRGGRWPSGLPVEEGHVNGGGARNRGAEGRRARRC